jgi:hypothetical protein
LITQSNYLPWRGWYAAARLADVLVYLDDVQFTRRDWRNRNLIADARGSKWLSVPLQNSGNYHSLIHNMVVSESKWWLQHLNLLDQAYGEFDSYQTLRPELSSIFASLDGIESLSEINRLLNEWIFFNLKIKTCVRDSREFPSSQRKTARLLEICQALGATEYISGPAARAYLDESQFETNSINVRWIDYNFLPSPLVTDNDMRELSVIHHLAIYGAIESIRISTFEFSS